MKEPINNQLIVRYNALRHHWLARSLLFFLVSLVTVHAFGDERRSAVAIEQTAVVKKVDGETLTILLFWRNASDQPVSILRKWRDMYGNLDYLHGETSGPGVNQGYISSVGIRRMRTDVGKEVGSELVLNPGDFWGRTVKVDVMGFKKEEWDSGKGKLTINVEIECKSEKDTEYHAIKMESPVSHPEETKNMGK